MGNRVLRGPVAPKVAGTFNCTMRVKRGCKRPVKAIKAADKLWRVLVLVERPSGDTERYPVQVICSSQAKAYALKRALLKAAVL